MTHRTQQSFWRAVDQPPLAICGDHSEILGRNGARAFSRDVPDADGVLLDVGHVPLGSRPEAVGEHILAFLVKQPTPISSRA